MLGRLEARVLETPAVENAGSRVESKEAPLPSVSCPVALPSWPLGLDSWMAASLGGLFNYCKFLARRFSSAIDQDHWASYKNLPFQIAIKGDIHGTELGTRL